jgi:hypothetical protein
MISHNESKASKTGNAWSKRCFSIIDGAALVNENLARVTDKDHPHLHTVRFVVRKCVSRTAVTCIVIRDFQICEHQPDFV